MTLAVQTNVSQDSTAWTSLPSGVVDGDFVLAIMEEVAAGAITDVGGDGFTFAREAAFGSGREALAHIVASSLSSSVNLRGAQDTMVSVAVRVSGQDTSTPLDVAIGRAASATCPSVTTVTDGCLILRAIVVESSTDNVTFAPPAGLSLEEDTFAVDGLLTTYANVAIFSEDDLQSSAGETGTAAITVGGGGTPNSTASYTIAIRPVAVASGDDPQVSVGRRRARNKANVEYSIGGF